MIDNEKNEFFPELYSDEETEVLEKHIEKYFGNFDNVFHEIFSPDIHVDICIIDPTPEKKYYTLVTMGMGAHKMNVPEELKEKHMDRAELIITVPADWDITSNREKYYWVIRWMKILARLPIEEDTWLGWGHTIANPEYAPFAENTGFCGLMLVDPQICGSDGSFCILPDGGEVLFYQLIPLYKEEMEYKLDHDAGSLMDRMEGISHVVDVFRPNFCNGYIRWELIMDKALWHLKSLREKKLPVDELTAYNHLAIYLRWCIEKDLMSEDFKLEFEDEIKSVKAHDGRKDLRVTLRDYLNGTLSRNLFNSEGRDFAEYYYGDDDSHRYPCDVDDNALNYFGEEKYNSDEFQDEAYLFVPFDEEYYQSMKKYIDKNYADWRRVYGGNGVSQNGIFS
ncbi:MAG: suppressor of fused domain protein [Oscillospiraceae bacterium]